MSFLLQSSKVLEEFCILTTTFPNSVGVERLRRRGLFSICFLAFYSSSVLPELYQSAQQPPMTIQIIIPYLPLPLSVFVSFNPVDWSS
mgnify:CR=1 FL=1